MTRKDFIIFTLAGVLLLGIVWVLASSQGDDSATLRSVRVEGEFGSEGTLHEVRWAGNVRCYFLSPQVSTPRAAIQSGLAVGLGCK